MNAKDKALSLRKQGYSYSYIAKVTKLSKSTLSYHLSKLPYSPNEETIATIGKARAAAIKTKADSKRKVLELIATDAKKELNDLTEKDLLMLGLGLYIGEGSKTQDLVRLVNSDFRVIKLTIKWLQLFGVSSQNLALRIHLYPDSDIKSAEDYWLKVTGLKQSNLQKACVDIRLNKSKKRKGTHPYGTAHLTVRANGDKQLGVQLARRISAYMEEVLQ